jgi:septum formation protein
MRQFSDGFLDSYLISEEAAILGSVGGYCLEGRGIQLFSEIQGDYFSILGLPLLELVGFLRSWGALGS